MGTPKRKKLRIWILLSLTAVVFVVLAVVAPGMMLEKRAQRGEFTPSDRETFRANPMGWLNMLGDFMLQAAERGDVAVMAQQLEFMLLSMDEMTIEERRSYKQVAIWQLNSVVATLPSDDLRNELLLGVDLSSEGRLSLLCPVLEGYVGTPGDMALMSPILDGIVAAFQEDPSLRTGAASHCLAGFVELIRANGDEESQVLRDLIRQTSQMGTVVVGEALLAGQLNPRQLAILSSFAHDTFELEPTDELSALLVGPLLTATREVLAGVDSRTVYWELVSDDPSSVSVVVLAETLLASRVVEGFSALDRLLEHVPSEHSSALVATLNAARVLIDAEVATYVGPAVDSCVGPEVSRESWVVRLDPIAPHWRTNAPDGVRQCIVAALNTQLPEGTDVLSRAIEIIPPFPTVVP